MKGLSWEQRYDAMVATGCSWSYRVQPTGHFLDHYALFVYDQYHTPWYMTTIYGEDAARALAQAWERGSTLSAG